MKKLIFALVLATNFVGCSQNKEIVDAEVEAEVEVVEDRSKWQYRGKVDEMRGNTLTMGTIGSKNTVNFDFPYNNPNGSQLVVHYKSFGNDSPDVVMIDIITGQFNCSTDCSLNVKFGNKDVKSYDFEVDSSTSTIFSNDKEFIENITENLGLSFIEAEFHGHGTSQFKFDFSNFDRDKMKNSANMSQ